MNHLILSMCVWSNVEIRIILFGKQNTKRNRKPHGRKKESESKKRIREEKMKEKNGRKKRRDRIGTRKDKIR
jgi:cytochrome b subunit of formate dehydrogenase